MKYNSSFINEEEIFDYVYFTNDTFSDLETVEEEISFRTILLSIEVGIGVIVNLLTFAVVCRGKSIDSSIRSQLLNVAVSDFLFCFAVIFGEHVVGSNEHIHTIGLCRFTWLILYGLTNATLLWRMTISIEQYVMIRSSNGREVYTGWKKAAVAIVTWTMSFVISIYYAVSVSIFHWQGEDDSFRSACHLHASGAGIIVSLIMAMVPVIVMSVMWALVCYNLCCGSTYAHLESQQTAEYMQVKQTVRMLAADAVTFVFTWMPIHLLSLALAVGLYVGYMDLVILFTALSFLLLLKCFDTPLIYFIASPSFREDTKALFCSCCPARDASSTPAATDTYQLVETELT